MTRTLHTSNNDPETAARVKSSPHQAAPPPPPLPSRRLPSLSLCPPPATLAPPAPPAPRTAPTRPPRAPLRPPFTGRAGAGLVGGHPPPMQGRRRRFGCKGWGGGGTGGRGMGRGALRQGVGRRRCRQQPAANPLLPQLLGKTIITHY